MPEWGGGGSGGNGSSGRGSRKWHDDHSSRIGDKGGGVSSGGGSGGGNRSSGSGRDGSHHNHQQDLKMSPNGNSCLC